jgi:HPt (histidine-containing phosphotransfer) domain-containing protein
MAVRNQNEFRKAQVSLAHSSRPSTLHWDRGELLERLDSDQEFLCELLRIFRQDCGANLQNGSDGFTGRRSARAHARGSHHKGGMLKNLCMNRAGEIAHTLETSARQQQSELAESSLAELELAIAELLPEVDAHLAGIQA